MTLCLMFHSVGLRKHRWASPQIAEDIEPFRDKLIAIRRAGYRILPFSDPRLHDPSCREKLACLTFDDGYLDNWVHAQPLLEEFEAPATIFVSTDFIDPTDTLRPQRPGQKDADHEPVGCCAGFLGWPELRALQSGGLVEIGSHAATHSQWPVGPEIIDYWRPGSATQFLGPVHELWNRLPERKPFYLTTADEDERRIPFGTPVYSHKQALVATRFFPDDEALLARLNELVDREGGANFFADEERALQSLRAETRRWLDEHGGSVPGRFESQQERDQRVRAELAGSRQILSEGLGVDVASVCWPQGGVDERVLEIAREVGYRRFTLPSAWLASHRRGAYSDLIPRISSVPRENRGDLDLGHLSAREFVWYLKRQDGSAWHKMLYRGAKLARIARAKVLPYT